MKHLSLFTVFLITLITALPVTGQDALRTILDELETAELIAVGRVVPREGDPTTFEYVRHAFEIESLLAGEHPRAPVLLQGGRMVTYDPESGEPNGGGSMSHRPVWREGERVIAFLNRTEDTDVWRANWQTGVHRSLPGDVELVAEHIRNGLELLANTAGSERSDALQAWAFSLLGHLATLDTGLSLLVHHLDPDAGAHSFGALSEEQTEQLVQATLHYAEWHGWQPSYTLWSLFKLTKAAPSSEIDIGLAYLVSRQWKTYPGQRADYAVLLAERLDDDELRELALAFSGVANSRDSASEDASVRGAWMIEVNELGWSFRKQAMDRISRRARLGK